MLKTRYGDTIRLVTQPNHAVAAGYMASHWGNEEFTKLGFYDNCSEPEKLAAETIFGIAEHDNGWWEWEASPSSSESDKLPLGLAEVLSNPTVSTQRWRIGTTRFEDSHPYGSLLINLHAYRLYGAIYDDEIHPLFVGSKSIPKAGSPEAIELINILKSQQEKLKQRLEKLGGWSKDAIKPEILQPHARMMQMLDAFSLALCSDLLLPVSGKAKGLGQDEIEFYHLPRKSWQDKVTIKMTPKGNNTLELDPYPFDTDNFTVPIIITEIDVKMENQISLSGLYKIPKKIVSFTFQKSN